MTDSAVEPESGTQQRRTNISKYIYRRAAFVYVLPKWAYVLFKPLYGMSLKLHGKALT